MKSPSQADLIKVGAVLTTAPRWVGISLIADGVPIPPSWLGWWRIITAVGSAGMAVTEALAISYMLNSWRNQRTLKGAWLLILFAVLTLATYTIALAPYPAANVRDVTVASVLENNAVWLLWAAAVASSTGVTVLGVGYAQRPPRKQPQAPTPIPQSEPEAEQEEHLAKCDVPGCGFERMYSTERGAQCALSAHGRKHQKGESDGN